MYKPCKDCPDRELYCHSYCEKYKKYQQMRTQIQENRQKYINKYMPTSKCLQTSYKTMRKFNKKYRTAGGTVE